MRINETAVFKYRVNFDEVDMGGAVHHPNYFIFFEKARCHYLEEAGYRFSEMMKDGYALVIAETHQKFIKPAFLDDDLVILTQILEVNRASMTVHHAVVRSQETNFKEVKDFKTLSGLIHLAEIRLVCVGLKDFKPCAFPERFSKCIY